MATLVELPPPLARVGPAAAAAAGSGSAPAGPLSARAAVLELALPARGWAAAGALGLVLHSAAAAAAARRRRRRPGPCLRPARGQREAQRWAAATARAAGQVDPSSLVFCFDFDGVICDSVDESSEAAWRHAKQLWPFLEAGSSPNAFLKPMRRLRPVVETGWENTVLIRLLIEAGLQDGDDDMPRMGGAMRLMGGGGGFDSGMDFDGGLPSSMGRLGGAAEMVMASVLGSWEEMREQRVKEWRLNPQEMIKEYGEVRDRWIAADKAGWLKRNRTYGLAPDVLDAMQQAGAQVFIITTKQRRFCSALLKEFALEIPEDHIFALEDGPKTEVLQKLLARPDLAGRTFHFVEDKLGTLTKVAALPELAPVRLHHAEWGYVTDKERKIVRSGVLDRISSLTLDGLEVLGLGKSWLDA